MIPAVHALVALAGLDDKQLDGTRLFHEDKAHLRHAINYGLMSGVFIASYTLWDRHGVHGLNIPPVLYDGGTAFTFESPGKHGDDVYAFALP